MKDILKFSLLLNAFPINLKIVLPKMVFLNTIITTIFITSSHWVALAATTSTTTSARLPTTALVSNSASSKKLVLLGDSITEGLGVAKESTYGALLQEKIVKAQKNWVVVNSGVSGSTSASAPSRMKWILKSKPDLIILALGANDALRGLKLEATKKNLLEALQLAQKAGVKVILAGMLTPPNYGKKYSQDFAQLYKDVAQQSKVKLIPFLLEGVAGHTDLNIADGIHPNEKGHQVISEIVYKAIEDYL